MSHILNFKNWQRVYEAEKEEGGGDVTPVPLADTFIMAVPMTKPGQGYGFGPQNQTYLELYGSNGTVKFVRARDTGQATTVEFLFGTSGSGVREYTYTIGDGVSMVDASKRATYVSGSTTQLTLKDTIRVVFRLSKIILNNDGTPGIPEMTRVIKALKEAYAKYPETTRKNPVYVSLMKNLMYMKGMEKFPDQVVAKAGDIGTYEIKNDAIRNMVKAASAAMPSA
jgi:hypothetical protein